ncbi:MAG TPA: hypothetical protein VGO86_19505, partial [Candidatus Dormibacteraeota bacterium]
RTAAATVRALTRATLPSNMSEQHPCGGCGSPILSSRQWLCGRCIVAWEAAIERQTNPRRHVADQAERRAIQRYRAQAEPS